MYKNYEIELQVKIYLFKLSSEIKYKKCIPEGLKHSF